jgi:WD40 repeat protein
MTSFVDMSWTKITSSHGRDHKLRVWRIASAREESLLDLTLPVDRKNQGFSSQAATSAAQPWLVHSLPVNALNFCGFSLCMVPETYAPTAHSTRIQSELEPGDVDSAASHPNSARDSAYFAVPNALNSGAIDIFHLPSEKRVSTIPADPSIQTGMVMAVNIFVFSAQKKSLYVVSGYEDGHAMVHARRSLDVSTEWQWERLYAARPHTQPVLSLDIVRSTDPAKESYCFITSSADALLVKHSVPPVTGLSSATVERSPRQILNTKHAGQQGLRVRSDNKIFATAGWDARVRVYSCKAMSDLAVLKWHKEGCYAVAFAEIISPASENQDEEDGFASSTVECREDQLLSNTVDIAHPPVGTSLEALRQQRSYRAQQTHWLAAGSKDGRISLWDIY